MDPEPFNHPFPTRRDMLAYLDVRTFLDLWTLTIRCACGRERVAPLPGLAKTSQWDREERTLGKLVRQLVCQDCGQRPISVIVEHAPSNEREEMVA